MNWSIWILEYGYVDRFPASNLFAAQPNEGHRRMPYCFGLLRSADRCILVDTGFADAAVYERLSAKYGETRWCAPVDVLARVGVRPDQVDTVLVVGGIAALAVATILGAVYASRALVPIRSSLAAQRRR